MSEPAPDSLYVFDRRTVRRHRDRAAARAFAGDNPDFLHREVAERLVERLDEVRRDFARVLELGCHRGALTGLLAGRAGIETLLAADLSPACAALSSTGRQVVHGVAADEEALPFAPGVFGLVVSNLALHWVNDVPGTLIQIRRALKPDGLLLASFLGGGTLAELREALMAAELEIEGGASPRVSPFADVRDAGALLQRAGFALPVVDRDRITVSYDSAFDLMADLRAMAETNAVAERSARFSRRATLLRAAELYQERFGGSDGRITASFEVIYLTAWAPAAAQPQPLAPGSATGRLADALGTREIAAGDPARLEPPKRGTKRGS
ncbi:MAG: methyltransferase domain-containing protein [Alphaproteobacteria bacterium]|nr:methyltransferase domain-containing protein [Alphaproteobacteria bacterium]